ncbi:hydroxylysine kinase isoform X1 [Microplitis mediator]|uniref:hydroxylysine kinase isoform X1 n=1 Tax=Microplitis mediator TaxID=375433 RepID=UPI002553E338|nr:hydroxylysine kinase isoform X1 [Microplitis mediator]XP_057319903.1 hydroxylysine kinase isoform X1 [Microplitis mediator]
MALPLTEKKIRPVVNDEIVRKLVEKLYGFKVKSIQELNSYDDKNYRIICYPEFENIYVKNIANEGYVLKIINSLDSQDQASIEGQNEMMLYLNKCNISCSVPIPNLCGSYYSLEKLRSKDTTEHIVRLLIFCPGEILYNAKVSPELLFDVGYFITVLNEALSKFYHYSYQNRNHLWTLLALPRLHDYLFVIKNENDKLLIKDVIKSFETSIVNNLDQFDKGIIHGDLNEQNILINSEHNKIIGIIDFGDTQYSCLIFELSIAVCYMIVQACDITAGKYVIKGYTSKNKLSNYEKKILKIAVCARICQSLVLGIHSHLDEPDNNYLIVTQKSGWNILRELWPMKDDDIIKMWDL